MAATKKKAGRKKATRKKAVRKKASRKKTARATTTRKKAGRPKGSKNKRGASLSRMTTSALSAELARRQRRLPMLQRQHADLMNKLEAIEAEIAEMGGNATGGGATRGRKPSGRPAGRPVGSGGGKRPRNAKNLEDTLADTLRGKTMSVTEATAAVQSRGYKTTAANFRTIVNATLLKSKKIKKVSRGQYTAK
jgi:hypothetical protein